MRWEDGLEYSLELWSLIDGLLGFYRIKILVCHVLHKNDLPQIVSSKAMPFFQIIWGNDRKGNKRNKGLVTARWQILYSALLIADTKEEKSLLCESLVEHPGREKCMMLSASKYKILLFSYGTNRL